MNKGKVIEILSDLIQTIEMDHRQDLRGVFIIVRDKNYKINYQEHKDKINVQSVYWNNSYVWRS